MEIPHSAPIETWKHGHSRPIEYLRRLAQSSTNVLVRRHFLAHLSEISRLGPQLFDDPTFTYRQMSAALHISETHVKTLLKEMKFAPVSQPGRYPRKFPLSAAEAVAAKVGRALDWDGCR